MKIVIDTNIWISALLSQNMRERLERLIGNPDIVILGSPVLLAEIEAVANRPKFVRRLSPKTVKSFLEVLSNRLDILVPTSHVTICKDPKDDFLLALAKDGKAAFLLSGDKGLLQMIEFEDVKIASLSKFEEIIDQL